MAQGPGKQTRAYFLPITNYNQFIMIHYQEVGRKTAHTATLKKDREHHLETG